MEELLSTKEVAAYLDVNEKMVYTLVAEKGLPASKVTGKWLFPLKLVEQWVEANTINYPNTQVISSVESAVLVIAGSNDPLLGKAISLFNRKFGDILAVFGNLGSMGGLAALRRNRCHIASCHLLHSDESEYNFGFAEEELKRMPAVVNFCQREQGLVVSPECAQKIKTIADLGKPGIRIVNRRLGTGTRLLLDKELEKAGISPEKMQGYDNEVDRHMDVGLEVLTGKADAGPAIRIVAQIFGLDFIPVRWERFDLLISKQRFFDKSIQTFLSLLYEQKFKDLVRPKDGYDLSLSGKMVYPADLQETEPDPDNMA